MINYREGDIRTLPKAERLLLKLGGIIVDDEEVWMYSRESIEIPTFENDIYELTCSRIEALMSQKYPEIRFEYTANCAVSSFYISGDRDRVFHAFDSIE